MGSYGIIYATSAPIQRGRTNYKHSTQNLWSESGPKSFQNEVLFWLESWDKRNSYHQKNVLSLKLTFHVDFYKVKRSSTRGLMGPTCLHGWHTILWVPYKMTSPGAKGYSEYSMLFQPITLQSPRDWFTSCHASWVQPGPQRGWLSCARRSQSHAEDSVHSKVFLRQVLHEVKRW